MTGLKQDMLDPMISLIKEVEPGYSGIFAVSEVEATMRSKRTKNKNSMYFLWCRSLVRSLDKGS